MVLIRTTRWSDNLPAIPVRRRYCTVSGTALLADGNPAVNRRVWIFTKEELTENATPTVDQAIFTDAQGHFSATFAYINRRLHVMGIGEDGENSVIVYGVKVDVSI